MPGKKAKAAPPKPPGSPAPVAALAGNGAPQPGLGAAWLRSLDVAIPLAAALGVASALGIWQIAQRVAPHGIEVVAPVVPSPVKAVAAAPTAGAALLDAAVEENLRGALSAAPPSSPAWITASPDDADALARAEQLRALLAGAGWDVRPVVQLNRRNGVGYFVIAADQEPPEYVMTLSRALETAGLKTTVLTDYRAYVAEHPQQRGGAVRFEFQPDQSFWLVVGRRP